MSGTSRGPRRAGRATGAWRVGLATGLLLACTSCAAYRSVSVEELNRDLAAAHRPPEVTAYVTADGRRHVLEGHAAVSADSVTFTFPRGGTTDLTAADQQPPLTLARGQVASVQLRTGYHVGRSIALVAGGGLLLVAISVLVALSNLTLL